MTKITIPSVSVGEEYLGSIKDQMFPVLNKGFVRIIDYMGADPAIVQAARVSYGIGTKTVNEDRGLIRYLMSHSHTTPFEMCEIKLHVKLPIFVARQWIRHRTANVNEYSGRYSIMKNEFYVPEVSSMGKQSEKNAQGREVDEDEFYGEMTIKRNAIQDHSNMSYNMYEYLLGTIETNHTTQNKETDVGLANELARMVLPQNLYTEWYWKIDLHNLLHFLLLRSDSHAQWEIQQYANVILNMVKRWVPYTYDAFMDYKVNSITFSRPELEHLRIRLLESRRFDNMTDREFTALKMKLKKVI